MDEARTVTFHPMMPGWWFHHYEASSHSMKSYAVVGFETVALPYAPDPDKQANPDPRQVEARMAFVGNDSIVALVLTGRPGEVTFRFLTENEIGAVDGCTQNWLGLYPGRSREELDKHFSEDIHAMRENLRKEHTKE